MGLVDSQSTHTTFNSSLFNGHIDVLVDCINEFAPQINWYSVMEALDHEKFYLPNQEAFSLLTSIHTKTCQGAFPVQTVCGSVRKNDVGQLSFLIYIVVSFPEILTFTNSRRCQLSLEYANENKLPRGSTNQAWLSIDLVEVLCQLA